MQTVDAVLSSGKLLPPIFSRPDTQEFVRHVEEGCLGTWMLVSFGWEVCSLGSQNSCHRINMDQLPWCCWPQKFAPLARRLPSLVIWSCDLVKWLLHWLSEVSKTLDQSQSDVICSECSAVPSVLGVPKNLVAYPSWCSQLARRWNVCRLLSVVFNSFGNKNTKTH